VIYWNEIPQLEDFMLTRFSRLLLSLLLLLILLCFSLAPSHPLSFSSEAARAAACPPDGCKVYLPLSLRFIDQVSNGDFESGPAAWREYSFQNYLLILKAPGELQIPPHSGSWAAWLGGVDEETASIDQNIYVSAAHSGLQYWQWIESDEPDCSKDEAEVLVDALVLLTFNLCQSNSVPIWERRTLDLSAYSGRLVNLKFQVTTNAVMGTTSSLYLDDISLQGSP
jgi:hypothetical protein